MWLLRTKIRLFLAFWKNPYMVWGFPDWLPFFVLTFLTSWDWSQRPCLRQSCSSDWKYLLPLCRGIVLFRPTLRRKQQQHRFGSRMLGPRSAFSHKPISGAALHQHQRLLDQPLNFQICLDQSHGFPQRRGESSDRNCIGSAPTHKLWLTPDPRLSKAMVRVRWHHDNRIDVQTLRNRQLWLKNYIVWQNHVCF